MSIDVINEFVKVMNEKPVNAPSVLYHYTTPEGLIGIVNSQELWLTDCKFLNDPSEKQHGLEISEVASLSVWNDLMTGVLASIELILLIDIMMK